MAQSAERGGGPSRPPKTPHIPASQCGQQVNGSSYSQRSMLSSPDALLSAYALKFLAMTITKRTLCCISSSQACPVLRVEEFMMLIMNSSAPNAPKTLGPAGMHTLFISTALRLRAQGGLILQHVQLCAWRSLLPSYHSALKRTGLPSIRMHSCSRFHRKQPSQSSNPHEAPLRMGAFQKRLAEARDWDTAESPD